MVPAIAVIAFCLGVATVKIVDRVVKVASKELRRRLSTTDSTSRQSHLTYPPGDCCCGPSTVSVSAPVNGVDGGEEGFLPFSDYAACNILKIQPSDIIMCELYANLKCCAALFLKADRPGMLKELKAGPTGAVLRQQARMASVAGVLCPSQPPSSACILGASRCPADLKSSYNVCIEGSLQLLLLELEVQLYRYLTHHWEQLEDIAAINEDDTALCTSYLAATHHPSPPSSPDPPTPLSSVDSLSSIDSFLSARLTGQGPSYRSGSSRSHAPISPARRNWQRAFRAAVRHVASRRLSLVRKVRSLHEIFKSLQASNHQQEREARQQPVLLLLGGGMAAGKSTVREIIGRSEFWSRVGKDAVVVEADAIKFQDIVYQKLSQRKEFSDDLNLRAEVHEYATKAAEGLLVAALNAQRDIVFDGTHAWLPFIQQTIAMARDHTRDYGMGPGYHQAPDGSTQETYWVPLPPSQGTCNGTPLDARPAPINKQPYRIELAGVTCDPGLAVVRGIWRRIRTGRSVPIRAQLRSHRLFAQHFEAVAELVDSTTLYHTGGHLSTFNKTWDDMAPKIIAHRSAATQGEMLVNPGAYEQFLACRFIDDGAVGVEQLYGAGSPPVATSCPLRTIPELHNPGLRGLLAALHAAYVEEVTPHTERHPTPPPLEAKRPTCITSPSPDHPNGGLTSWPSSPSALSAALKPLSDQLLLRRMTPLLPLSPRSMGAASEGTDYPAPPGSFHSRSPSDSLALLPPPRVLSAPLLHAWSAPPEGTLPPASPTGSRHSSAAVAGG